MRLTITISNWNRGWHLERSIHLISKQTLSQDEWELIIVDDGSTDNSEEIITKYKEKNIIKNFHYIKKVKKREKYGNCAIARNIGAKFGSGDYILFTDPEVMPLQDWAEKHYLAHKQRIVPLTDAECVEKHYLADRQRIFARPGGGLYKFDTSQSLDQIYVQEGTTDRHVIGLCLQPREYHIVTENCKGPLLGNAYVDYNWFDIAETWKIINDKIKKAQREHNIDDRIIEDEFFIYQATQAGHSLSRKLFFDVRGFEENFANANMGFDKWSGEDTWFHKCLDRLKSMKIELSGAKAIHIYHDKVCDNYYATNYAYKYAAEHPDQWWSNLDREWGLIEENGFKVIF